MAENSIYSYSKDLLAGVLESVDNIGGAIGGIFTGAGNLVAGGINALTGGNAETISYSAAIGAEPEPARAAAPAAPAPAISPEVQGMALAAVGTMPQVAVTSVSEGDLSFFAPAATASIGPAQGEQLTV